MLILGIESSCDETAAAVVADGPSILSDLVASQDEVHSPFGGVVPELAAREHLMRVAPLAREALARAGIGFADLDAIAVTAGPGLVVCLLVGLSAAKGMALSTGLPLVGVNHLDGHLSAIFLDKSQPPPEHPFIGLVVSGGHSSLYHVAAPGQYRLLGQTLDDAAGEAFDKVAKVLGLPYPGGREIDRLAEQGDERAIAFPRPLLDRPDFNFSFSGLKTAVITYWKKIGGDESARPDIAASFQAAAVEVLAQKTLRAAVSLGAKTVVACGGVAVNRRLRRGLTEVCEPAGITVRIPSPRLCTDNAAMIAAAGLRLFAAGARDGLDLAPRAVWPLQGEG